MADPLGLYVETIYGKDSMDSGYTTPFANLYRIWKDLSSDVTSRLTLSKTQERSFWTLWEWWSAYKSLCTVESDAPETDYCRHFAEGQAYELHVGSRHFQRILALFEMEFASAGFGIDLKRQDTATWSACRNVALHCLRYQSAKLPLHVSERLDPLERDFITSRPPGTFKYSIDSGDQAGLHPRCTSGATAESCPWLTETTELPWYLWDRHTGKTIETVSLAGTPSYVAVSHTWGRWRKPGQSTMIPGVNSWRVPENTLFDVRQLPQILASFPIEMRYIWFDLVCIPQDQSNRAQSEIAKQAAIFKNAKHAIVWFNNLESWVGLRLAVEQMGVHFWRSVARDPLDNTDMPTGLFGNYVFQPNISSEKLLVNGWFSSLWTLQEICLRPDMWLCNKKMELFTVAGGTLPVAINTIIALTRECTTLLDAEIALCNASDRLQLNLTRDRIDASTKMGTLIGGCIAGQEVFRRGYLELAELFERTGMTELHNITRDQILLLGSNRFCLQDRAEAIMSVLGVTAWRADHVLNDLQSQVDRCVLQQYPLEFVQEAAAAIGSAFYNTISVCSESVLEPDGQVRQKLKGSLMPFQTNPRSDAEMKLILHWQWGSVDQSPAVSSWVILQTGAVQIRNAAILTSSTDSGTDELTANVWLTHSDPVQTSAKYAVARNQQTRYVTVDLRDWCRTYFPCSGNYAVEIDRVSDLSRGLLFKEVTKGSQKLIKVGNYITSALNQLRGISTEPQMTEMNWIIL